MKIEVTLTKAEAQKLLGTAIKSAFTAIEGLEVRAVDWDAYGSSVTVEFDAPRPNESDAAA